MSMNTFNNQKNNNQGKSFNQLNQNKNANAPMLPKPGEEEKLSSTWLYVAIVAGVILLGSGWLIARHNSSITKNATSTEETAMDVLPAVSESGLMTGTGSQAMAAETTSNGETLTILDQPASKTVLASSMKITATSWVAVRDVKTQHILGARRFEPGTTSGFVELLKSTVAEQQYEGVIYVDDGDKTFDFHKDSLVSGVVSTFTAQ